MSPASNTTVLRGAAITGLVNAIINGAVQYLLLRGHGPIPLSVDGITNSQQTVLGTAVPLAVSLAMILTAIGYFTLKAPKRAFFPGVLWLIIKHGLFAFGLVVAGAVVWQRAMGSVPVSLSTAVVVLALIAGFVSGIVNAMTLRGCLLDAPEAALSPLKPPSEIAP